ncbi:ABC transporter ATP-binding protein [Desulfurella multipotens]|uniref:ABC transporter ATP-binding protein n=1 Tax=Desulfurella multipotens TaxID=79269 RepID=UPI000CBACA95|nr:ABC transporter ATP-binding protein [Desulfurella multipotens]PMP68770.1 MAG: lipoprotein-releasing system ATP-binding protein LolD [Desulfurella multipotens]
MIISAHNIKKSFKSGKTNTLVLNNVNLDVEESKMVAIMGVSGSGKSTLLHILGLLDEPDDGEVLFFGEKVIFSDKKKLAIFRNSYIGFVFQFYSLINELTVLENVLLPTMINGIIKKDYARELLLRVGISEELFDKRSYNLSGGEKQRVAVARALVNKPKLIIADEPTSNIDENNAMLLMTLLRNLQQSLNTTVVISTHSKKIANFCDITYFLSEGVLTNENNI